MIPAPVQLSERTGADASEGTEVTTDDGRTPPPVLGKCRVCLVELAARLERIDRNDEDTLEQAEDAVAAQRARHAEHAPAPLPQEHA